MACSDCNGGCGGGSSTVVKLLDKAGLQHIVDVLSGKLFTVWGSLRVSATAPLRLTKTVGDAGETIVEGAVDEATVASAGVMSAADKAKLDGLEAYDVATETADGLLSSADKAKLDGLEAYDVATSESDGLFSSLQWKRLQELWDAYQSGAFTCPCEVEYALELDVEYNDGVPVAATPDAAGYLPVTTLSLVTRTNGIEGRTVVEPDDIMYVPEQSYDWADVTNEGTGLVVVDANSGTSAREFIVICTAHYTAPDGTLLEAVNNYMFWQAGVDSVYSLLAELQYNGGEALPAVPASGGYAPSLSCALLRTYPTGMSSRTEVEPSLVAWSLRYGDTSSPEAWAAIDASGVLTVEENLLSSSRSVVVVAQVYYDAPDGSALRVRVEATVEQAAARETTVSPDVGDPTSVVSYAAPVVSLAYGDLVGSGGSAAPVLSYVQAWSVDGVWQEPLTGGATVAYALEEALLPSLYTVAVDASSGALSWTAQMATVATVAVATVRCTVSLNGMSSTVVATVYASSVLEGGVVGDPVEGAATVYYPPVVSCVYPVMENGGSPLDPAVVYNQAWTVDGVWQEVLTSGGTLLFELVENYLPEYYGISLNATTGHLTAPEVQHDNNPSFTRLCTVRCTVTLHGVAGSTTTDVYIYGPTGD